MLNGLDIFSGIGGIALALAPWVRPVAYCEINHFACGVLMSRMADNRLHRAPIWDDVRSFRGASIIEPIDIITAGFPCQDLSLAGSGRGLEGERSGLYREVLRLIGELRPGFVFLENVAAIRGRGADVVVGDLAALGYDSRWTTFEASAVGAPHKRDRWWLLASNADGESLRVKPKRSEQNAPECGHAIARDARRARASVVAHPDGRGQSLDGSGIDGDGGVTRWHDTNGRYALPHWQAGGHPFPALRRVDDGARFRLDRLQALGNAVVPLAARVAFATLAGLDARSMS